MLTFGVGQGAGQTGHPARPVVDLGEDRLALDVGVAALVEDGLGRLVVGGRHDHVAAVAHAPAADRAKVDAARRERLGERRHRTRLVLQLDDELLGHGRPPRCGAPIPTRPGAHRTGTAAGALRVPSGAVTARHARSPAPIRPACPPAVAAVLATPDPGPGEPSTTEAAGIPFSSIAWGEPAARPLVLHPRCHGIVADLVARRAGPGRDRAPGRRAGPARARPDRSLGGHHRFRDNAADVAAWIRAAGLDVPDLQVVGHSWGAMTAAALPAGRDPAGDARPARSAGRPACR